MELTSFAYNGAATFPAGIVDWSDMSVVLVWFVLAAFIGSMLGILRERTSGEHPSLSRPEYAPDAELERAA